MDHFQTHGWVRIEGAFSAQEATAMRDVVWRALAAADGWHVDADCTGPLSPPESVKVHAMFGDVAPRAGGMNIISGSHRLVHR
jgi:hypothetical protein